MVWLVPTEPDQGPLTIGDMFLGKYEIVGFVGQGGNACVYHARHRYLGHHVAIKTLFRDTGVSKEMLRRGIMEAQIQHKLDHRGIVAVEDVGITENGILYIVMDLLSGSSLRDVLGCLGKLEPHESLWLGVRIADALQAAHGEGVVHRDVKPENIFITAGNEPKVLDFGIAKAIEKGAHLTGPNMVMGTLQYMSPEQLTTRVITAKTDIYALAVVMFETMIGLPPVVLAHGSRDVGFYDAARIIVKEAPQRLEAYDATIPPYIAALILKGMATSIHQRFETIGEFGKEMQRCLDVCEAEARAAGRQLVYRELSRLPKVRSGVERADHRTSAAHDTLPASRPLVLGSIPSDVVSRHQALQNLPPSRVVFEQNRTAPLVPPIARVTPATPPLYAAHDLPPSPPQATRSAQSPAVVVSVPHQRLSEPPTGTVAAASAPQPSQSAPKLQTAAVPLPTPTPRLPILSISPVYTAAAGLLIGLALTTFVVVRKPTSAPGAQQVAASLPSSRPLDVQHDPAALPVASTPQASAGTAVVPAAVPAPSADADARMTAPTLPTYPLLPAAVPKASKPTSRPVAPDKMTENMRLLDEEMRKQKTPRPQPAAAPPAWIGVRADD